MDVSTSFLVLIPITIGLVQALKIVGLSKRFRPLVSVLIAILGATLLLGSFDKISIVQGIIAGLTSCGLWSGTKSIING